MQLQRNRERVSKLPLLHRHLFFGLEGLACNSLAASPQEPHPAAICSCPGASSPPQRGAIISPPPEALIPRLIIPSQSPSIRGCSTLTTGPPWDHQDITISRRNDDSNHCDLLDFFVFARCGGVRMLLQRRSPFVITSFQPSYIPSRKEPPAVSH